MKGDNGRVFERKGGNTRKSRCLNAISHHSSRFVEYLVQVFTLKRSSRCEDTKKFTEVNEKHPLKSSFNTKKLDVAATNPQERNDLVVSYYGEPGSYTEEAALKFFRKAILIPCRRLREVFEKVRRGDVEFGVIPIENSLEGAVGEAYDLLVEFNVMIYGEVKLRISHCLAALPDTDLKDVKYVYSHPQALAQCSKFLEKLGVEAIPYYSTSSAIKMIKEKGGS